MLCGGRRIPRRKPDSVVIHRLELSNLEREELQQYVMTKSIDNLVRPACLVGITAGVGLAAYATYKALKEYFGWATDAVDDLTGLVSLHASVKNAADLEGLTKEEAAEKYTQDELRAMSQEGAGAKAKYAKSPAGRFGRFINNLF